MKFEGIQKKQEGNYISYYHVRYRTESGREKIYEMISRQPYLHTLEQLSAGQPDAVIMILHDRTGERILLNHEFRLAVGEWVYNFPAGLIDPGETAAEAAARELREETGLLLKDIREQWAESYSAVGFSNEKGIVLVGMAEGDIGQSDSDSEEIRAAWYTKAEVRALLASNHFAARTQAYCALWCRQ